RLPPGLSLVGLSPLIPESARFLEQTGRADLARATLARFGVELSPASVVSAAAATEPESHAPVPPLGRGFLGVTAALTLAALAWGLVNFGLLLWLPAALIAEGRSVGASSALIARSTLIAAPTIVVCAWLFTACSKLGGLAAQALSVVAGVPPLAAAVTAIAVPAVGSTILIALYGRESRGRSLGELDAPGAAREPAI